MLDEIIKLLSHVQPLQTLCLLCNKALFVIAQYIITKEIKNEATCQLNFICMQILHGQISIYDRIIHLPITNVYFTVAVSRGRMYSEN